MAIPPFQQGETKQAKPQQLIMLKREINANAAAIQDLKRFKGVGPTCCPILKICAALAACICMFEGWILEEMLVKLTEGSISHPCN